MVNANIDEERQKRNDAILLKLETNTQRKMQEVTAALRNITAKMENEKQLVETLARVLTKWRLRSLLWALQVWKRYCATMVSTVCSVAARLTMIRSVC